MTTNTVSQNQENISILECLGDVATTTNTRKVATKGRQLKSGRVTDTLYVCPQHEIERAENPAVRQHPTYLRYWPESAVSSRPAQPAQPAVATTAPAVAALSSLKSRKPQIENGKSYLVYTGTYDACVAAARVVPESRVRHNGNNGNGLLIVAAPSVVANYSTAA